MEENLFTPKSLHSSRVRIKQIWNSSGNGCVFTSAWKTEVLEGHFIPGESQSSWILLYHRPKPFWQQPRCRSNVTWFKVYCFSAMVAASSFGCKGVKAPSVSLTSQGTLSKQYFPSDKPTGKATPAKWQQGSEWGKRRWTCRRTAATALHTTATFENFNQNLRH